MKERMTKPVKCKVQRDTRFGEGELALIPSGKRAYIWIGDTVFYGTISGPATLRKLAKAILAEVGD